MYGGGMYNFDGTSPTVINCTFSGNEALSNGGGMYNGAESDPTVINCTFSGNIAYAGGGMYNDMFSHPTVINCTFRGNHGAEEGGGMYNAMNSHPTVANCRFIDNLAYNGGGMYCQDAGPTVTNCTFTLNDAPSGVGGAMYVNGSAPSIANCVLWGDQVPEISALNSPSLTVTYSDVQAGTGEPWFGTGCIDVDPLFIDAEARLSASSLCIDAGSNGLLPLDGNDLDGDGDTGEPIPIDLDGHARVLCDVVDMGAYEFGIGDYNCDQVVDLTDFGSWPACMTGPDGGPYPAGCEAFDFEYDDDVDLEDFALFSQQFTGPTP
jgi:parallel beta-helix repeat protein